MARRKHPSAEPDNVRDFRHEQSRRKNNPPAGIAPTYEVRERQTTHYAYDPHLDPQLVWAGKAEHTSFEVDVVSLHIHERISTRAILDAVRRPEPLQLSLFGETPLPADKQIEFYQHEVGWANRLILGDSLLVMNSLLVKEGMAGKVQMIYIDPPYGIKYASNFQPRTDRRDVKDKDEDLTHEPEQIKAYRDTWKLGIHSYLTYLRDRLLLARELLTESGSVFVQINDENLHLVRCLMDEVFGRDNFVCLIAFSKTTGFSGRYLSAIADYLIWYARDITQTKYHPLYREKVPGDEGATKYRPVSSFRAVSPGQFRPDRLATLDQLTSQGEVIGTPQEFEFQGRIWMPRTGLHWKTMITGLRRLAEAERIIIEGESLRYIRFLDDYPVFSITNVWPDIGGIQSRTEGKLYAVQTASLAIERCILMTTDPGDLVLDPTCVRKGTRVLAPHLTSPVDGGGTNTPSPSTGRVGVGAAPSPSTGRVGVGAAPSPSTGRAGVGAAPSPSTGRAGEGVLSSIPIEDIHPGDLVCGHDGNPHRVLRIIRKPYCGLMVGIRHALSAETLWLTADHPVLCKPRPRTLGGARDWSASPIQHLERRKQLRHEASPVERRLWSALRNQQLGFKFRRQHPIGPYIADFYSREAHLVVEVDGASHFEPAAVEYDAQRDAAMRALGLDVLRFTAREVQENLEGVCLAIQNHCRRRAESVEGAQWLQAGSLQPGDLVFFGLNHQAVPIESIETMLTEEEVYDLEVEGAHSFITEVCVVHNCGSGTTAYCAEKWGRRWITCDTSRVALAIARQRLMTARYDYYELVDPERGPAGGFFYETVPHITLESIAKNIEIDAIAAKYQPQIDQALAELNQALGTEWKEWEVPRDLSSPFTGRDRVGASSPFTGRDRVGASSPSTGRVGEGAQQAHERFWSLKRKKREEIDASIQRHAPQETLYDRPRVKRGVVRVTGPFTVEAIPVPAVEDPTQAPIPQFEDSLPVDEEGQSGARVRVSDRGGDYLTAMLNLLKQQGGVLFPGGKKMELQNPRPLNLGMLHGEAESPQNGKTLRVAISFGPQHGPVTAFQVQEAIPTAKMNGYEVLILAGFSFDPEAQALIQKAPVAGLQIHFANIAPDVLVGDLLKTTRASQIFTVFGQPDVRIIPSPPAGRGGDGQTYVVELRGVDIYDPLTGETQHTRGRDVAAWFLDTDYDGMTFHLCQAFFPGDPDAWDKLQRALKAQIDPEAFAQMRGTVSFPFQPGKHQRIAVKVIDFRGNEVVRVIRLND